MLLFLPACQLFSTVPTAVPADVQTMVAATMTANVPSMPTSALPTETPTPVPPSPTPTEYIPGEGIPPQASPLQVDKGVQTILLMGSDQRPGEGDFRTDTLVLVVLKPNGTVSMISFPRDLWVYLPGKGMQRINAAMEFGGFELVKSTFEYNFGFAPQSYVMTNFGGFKSIVDSLGGVDVAVGATLEDARDGFPDGFKVEPGVVHMDGETALWYVRSRKTSSDLDRLRRSQEVILAISRKLFSLYGLTRIPDVYSAYRSAVVTDLTLEDVTAFIPLLQAMDQNNIQRYAFTIDQVIPYMTTQGAAVLLPKPEPIHELLTQAMAE